VAQFTEDISICGLGIAFFIFQSKPNTWPSYCQVPRRPASNGLSHLGNLQNQRSLTRNIPLGPTDYFQPAPPFAPAKVGERASSQSFFGAMPLSGETFRFQTAQLHREPMTHKNGGDP
jgi:hypothetical protein